MSSEITKYVKRIRNEVYLAIFTILHILFLIWLHKLHLINYETNDDYYLESFLNGSYGQYSLANLYNNVIWSSFVNLLYRVIPGIRWGTIIAVFMIFVSYSVIAYLFTIRVKDGLTGFLFSLTVLLASYQYMYKEINFTKTAAIVTIAGVLLLEKTIRTTYGCVFVDKCLGVLLIWMGYCIRSNSAILVLSFGIVFIAFRAGYKKIRRSDIYLLSFVAFILLISYSLNSFYYSTPERKWIMQKIDLVSEIYDYKVISDAALEGVDWKNVGFDREDYEFARGGYFQDDKVFTIESLNNLLEYKDRLIISYKILDWIIGGLNNYVLFTITLLALMLAIVFSHGRLIEIIFFVIVAFAEEAFFLLRNRFYPRVVIIPLLCLLVIAFSYILNGNDDSDINLQIDGSKKNATLWAVAFAVFIYSFFSGTLLSAKANDTGYCDPNEFSGFISEIEKAGSDCLFVLFYDNHVFRAYAPFDHIDNGIMRDCIYDVGWISCTPFVKDKISEFCKGKNLYDGMLDGTRVYFIGDAYMNERVNFIRKHYDESADVGLVYKKNTLEAFSIKRKMDPDSICDLCSWSVKPVTTYEGRTDYYEISGILDDYNNEDSYYIELSDDGKAYMYEVSENEGVFKVGVPVSTWSDSRRCQIKLLKKDGDSLLKDDEVRILEINP